MPTHSRHNSDGRGSEAGDITHSVALIDACKPWHWKDEFPPSNTPSPEVARKARAKFGGLLDGNGLA